MPNSTLTIQTYPPRRRARTGTEWVQIALILFRVELEKGLRETEDYLNEMPGILAVFDLNEAPHYSSFCRWEQDYQMRELRRLREVVYDTLPSQLSELVQPASSGSPLNERRLRVLSGLTTFCR